MRTFFLCREILSIQKCCGRQWLNLPAFNLNLTVSYDSRLCHAEAVPSKCLLEFSIFLTVWGSQRMTNRNPSQQFSGRDARNKEPVQNTQLLANVFFTLLGDRLRNSAMTGHFIVPLYKTHYHPLYLTVSAAIHVTTWWEFMVILLNQLNLSLIFSLKGFSVNLEI